MSPWYCRAVAKCPITICLQNLFQFSNSFLYQRLLMKTKDETFAHKNYKPIYVINKV